MILWALGLSRSLRGHHYRTIIITILLPVIVPPIIVNFGPTSLVLQSIVYAVAFIAWVIWSVLAVASMLKKDQSEAEQQVEQKLNALSGQISKLREGHEESRADLRQQVENLEEVVRSTFDGLGVVLPPRTISMCARITAGSPTMSATLTVVGGSKMARLRQWLRRTTRRLWEVVYGKPKTS